MFETAKMVMSKNIITIGIEDSVRKAYQVMQEKNIRHLPVVDKNRMVVGILSDRDIRRAMNPNTNFEVEFDSSHLVGSFMSWPAKTISKNASVIEIANAMLSEKLSALLVTGEDNAHPVGIVTTDDMLKLLIELLKKGDNHKSIKLKDMWSSDFSSVFV